MNTVHNHQFLTRHISVCKDALDLFDRLYELSHAPADYPAEQLAKQRAGYISHMRTLHCGYIEDDALVSALNESAADDAPEGNAEPFVLASLAYGDCDLTAEQADYLQWEEETKQTRNSDYPY